MRKLAIALGIVTLTGLGVAVAWAEPPAGSLGTLTLQPATGTNITAPVAQTSAGCATDSDSYLAKVYGPGGFEPGLLATDGLQTVNFSTSFGFPVQFTKSMADIALDNQTELVAGTYTVEVTCMDAFAQEAKGTFTTKMYFVTATSYQSTPPGGGTSTTTTTTTTTSSTTTTTTTTSSSEPPPSTETTVTSTPDAPQESVSVTVDTRKLAHTGSPLDFMLLIGIALVLLGSYALYTTRRRRVYAPTPWPED
jgi:LPXTG-motif cell wall-anchored protein